MNDQEHLYFPEDRSASAPIMRWCVGLLFLGIGIAATVVTFMGFPLEWSGGGEMPGWASLLVALVFAGAGIVMLSRREYAEVNLAHGRVLAWRDLGDTFRTAFPLQGFHSVRVVPWPEQGGAVEGYTLWLTSHSDDAFLQAFEERTEAVKRAQEAAAALKLKLELPAERS